MNDQQPGFFPDPEAFTRMWSDFAAQMLRSGMACSPEKTPPEAFREMRSAMLKAWSDYCDQSMRTPEFLNAMKQSLDASVQARKQLNDFLGQLQHEFQGASRQDVDQLMLSTRRLERRLVDAVDRLSVQLDQIQQRLERLERRAAVKRKKTDE